MEEIDIIELLKMSKEGKAPKEIQIENGKQILELYDDNDLEYMYFYKDNNEGNVYWLEKNTITLGTSIKILDKPIIPELPQINQNEYDTNSSYRSLVAYENRYKINEIIRYLNKEEK